MSFLTIREPFQNKGTWRYNGSHASHDERKRFMESLDEKEQSKRTIRHPLTRLTLSFTRTYLETPKPPPVRSQALLSCLFTSITPTFNDSPRVWWWTNADTIACAQFHARRIRAWILAIRSVHDSDAHTIQIPEWEMRRTRKG